MRLFGFEIKRKSDYEVVESFIPPDKEDGAVDVSLGGAFGTYVDLDGSIRTEAELVNKYREMSDHPDIDNAIENISTEAIVTEEGEDTVKIVLDHIPYDDPKLKDILEQEFDEVVRLLEFRNKAYEIFRRWYIDGRLYYHIIIDEKSPTEGIKELRYIDPRKIRKVRKLSQVSDKDQPNLKLTNIAKEFFLYNENSLVSGNKSMMNTNSTQGVYIAKDAICHVTSGLTDINGKLVVSYLHRAIRYLNIVRAIEDAVVIYRLSRAPERRVFYIDVGNLPKHKAEQYLREQMIRHKNKIVYDSVSGSVRDNRKFMTMIEDYYLPVRGGERGTKIDTLPPAQNLSQIEDLEHFQKRLYKSLKVPFSRMEPETVYSIGRTSEITRDEVNFGRFIDMLRIKFSTIFLNLMEKQVILKGLMMPEEWDAVKNYIQFRYLQDNYFAELKQFEILAERCARARDALEFSGVGQVPILSITRIRKDIFKQTDEDIEMINNEIVQEMQDPIYQRAYLPPEEPDDFNQGNN